jgi:hypothetical protein
MTVRDFITELKKWRFTRYKLINFIIGTAALLVYEFIARPLYRPYIYANKINDIHIADTIGNSLGTITTVFMLIALLSDETQKGNYLIKIGTLGVIFFELAHPLLGKPVDVWDIIASIISGAFCYLLYNSMFRTRP